MRARTLAALLFATGLLTSCWKPMPRATSGSVPPPPIEPTAAAASTATTTTTPLAEAPKTPLDLTVAGDVSARLAKLGTFVVDFDDSKLTAEQKAVLKKLVDANLVMHELFVSQVDPENPRLRAALAADPAKSDALRYFDIMAGPWDGLAHDEPFIGKRQRPAGAGFYPADMTKQELEQFVAQNPGQKDAFHGYFTVIQRINGKLTAVPYSQAYKAQLERAAADLRDAASLTSEPTFKRYLELRAKAFLSNDYFESDLAWLDVKGPLELTIGPYETYADQLFQYKASFESFVALRDAEESAKLDMIAKELPDIQQNLPLDDKYKKDASKRGALSPIDVVHLLCNAGQAGVQTLAYNLPNDERVSEAKGTKKVMLKNIFAGKYENILKPIAAQVLAADQLKLLSSDAVFTYILMHEVAHGVGPGFITLKDGSKGEVSKALLEQYGGIEEGKADITGLVNTQFLIDKGVYPKSLEKPVYVAYLATAFRQMRFGVKEAHGKAVVSSLNYLTKKGAILYDAKKGRFRVEFTKMKVAVRELAHDLLTIEAEGNYEGAKKFFATYATPSADVEKTLHAIGLGLPIDIAPRFTIYEKVKSW
jgi:hypothetical protein